MKSKLAIYALMFQSSAQNVFSTSAATKLVIAIATLLCGASSTYAANQTWTGSSSGAWRTAGNWSGGAFPGSSTSTTNTDIVTIAVAAQPTMGINFNNATSGVFSFGGINFSSSTNRVLGNSSGTVAGVLTLNGGTINSVNNVFIRNSSSGNFTFQANQSNTMGIALGNATNNVAVIDGTGNVVIESNISGSSKKLSVQGSGAGDLVLSGSNTFSGGIDISGSGKLRLSATTALPTTGSVSVSEGGRIRFAVAGTYGANTQTLTFNPNQTANPSLDLQTSNIAVTVAPNVTLSADTRFEPSGSSGSVTLSGNLSGSGALIKQAAGNLILSGTGNTASGATQIGNGTLTVNSGSAMGTGELTLAQTSTNATTVTLNNGSQSVGSLSSSWTATTGTINQRINLNGTALTVNQATDGTFGTGAVSTLTSTIAGTGSLTKSGSATLTLTSTNSYTGATTVNAGKLVVNGNISTSSLTTVSDTGTLGGSGTVGALTAASGGTIAPGNSPGILNAGNTILESGSTLSMEINGSTVGTGYDQLNVTGTVSLAGALNLTVTGYTPALNSLYFIINNDGTDAVTGTFSNSLTNGVMKFGGYDWLVSYQGDTATSSFTGGNDVVLQVIPETSTSLLSVLSALAMLRRRRQA